MDFIIVLAEIQPKSGCKDSIIELAEDLIENTLSEDGNIDYKLLQSINENTLTFVEKWQSPDALKEHMASPHFLSFGKDSEEFVEKMEIQVIGASEINL